jgi:citrate/tricarballylate utilization protein
MPSDERLALGEHVMTVCNACRYCEQFCPVFPAMENRLTFARGDLMYLANLCHNCGECLYACQYAPPHEFAINVPRTLAQIRLASYEDYCWPQPLARLFRRNGLVTSVSLACALTVIMFAATVWMRGDRVWQTGGAEFYAVVPHGLMVSLFGSVFAFVVLALAVSLHQFWKSIDTAATAREPPFSDLAALRDALTLRQLHASGDDCTSAEEERTPWRRWFHHCTFYGFMLCFASTTVAAIYHSVFHWEAPYPYLSLPVVLGTIGGLGLLAGPIGLLILRQRRDRTLGDPEQDGMDVSFITLLFLTSATGLLLLVLREQSLMGPLLIVHLGVVLALFVTLPYGKFVHGLYRAAALVKYAREDTPGHAANPDATPALRTPDYVGAPAEVRGEQPVQ